MLSIQPLLIVFLQTDARNSKLFKNFPKDVLQSLEVENITSNFHSWSLSLQVPLFKISDLLVSYFLLITVLSSITEQNKITNKSLSVCTRMTPENPTTR